MNIEVTEQELDTIMRALGQQPYVAVARVIQTIMGQVNAPPAAPPAVPTQ
jgi:hypothetical protein